MLEWEKYLSHHYLSTCKILGYVNFSSITVLWPKSGIFPGTRLFLP